MKTILFFRHGKSDWHAGISRDHERPINGRGLKDSRRMGEFLARIDELPDRIVTSTAVRAQKSLECAVEEGKWGDISTDVTARLYDASPGGVLAVIREQPDAYKRLMLVGHEPTWSGMISSFTGDANLKVSTAAMARVDIEADRWSDVEFGTGQLRWLVSPKLIR